MINSVSATILNAPQKYDKDIFAYKCSKQIIQFFH